MYKPPADIQTKHIATYKNLQDARVILRSCLNVKINEQGDCIDATRFYESYETIEYLAQKAKKVYILGHLGRPRSQEDHLSFRHNISLLLAKKGISHAFAHSIESLETYAQDATRVILVENIRFFSGEESKDESVRLGFAQTLAKYADIYVNDAFADYRIAASTYDIARILPSYIGFSMAREIEALSRLHASTHPFVCIMGGAKLSEKLDVLSSVAAYADKVIIGGAMAYTLLKAQGHTIGDSLHEPDKIDIAREVLARYQSKIILPVDYCIIDTFSPTAPHRFIDTVDIPDGAHGIDIGPRSIENMDTVIQGARTILWNGPLGISEWEHAAAGTRGVVHAIQKHRATIDFAIAGGGDSIAAIEHIGASNVFDHICTGGGAMLAYLGKKTFPTIDVLFSHA